MTGWPDSCFPLGMTPAELRKRLAEFAADVAKFTKPLLTSPEARDIARQLRKSSSSAAANHRAAGVGQSHGDFTAKIGIAAGEADESVYWLQHLRDAGIATTHAVKPLLLEATELCAILKASFGTAKIREEEQKRKKDTARIRRQ